MPAAFDISSFKSIFDNRPTPMRLTFPELVDALTRRPATAASKEAVPAWSPTSFRPGGKRCSSNATRISLLTLDVDEAESFEAAARAAEPWAHIVHTTFSHRADRVRLRVVFPLSSSVPAERWPHVWKTLVDGLGLPADAMCKDAGRMYLLPALSTPDAPFQATASEGPCLTVPDPPSARRAPASGRPVPIAPVIDAITERAMRAVAERAGAQIFEGLSPYAKHARCPACGDRSVWFPLKVDLRPIAACNHRNSCGWSGTVAQLGGA